MPLEVLGAPGARRHRQELVGPPASRALRRPAVHSAAAATKAAASYWFEPRGERSRAGRAWRASL